MGYGKHVISIDTLPLIKEVRDLINKNRINPVSSEFISNEITNPTLMIDWLSVKFMFWSDEKLNGGNIISTSPDGEIEYTVDKFFSIEGSHSSKINIRLEDARLPPMEQFKNIYLLSFSGNPVKWFQGHNVFGTDDINNLVYEVFHKLADTLGKRQPEWLQNSILEGNYSISRVDINGMFELDSRSDVLAWLHHLESTSRTRHGTATSKGSTVYLGKNSERWTLKFYSKGQEIEDRKHQLPPALQQTSIPKFANNKLRAELTLRSKELVKLGLNVGSAWFKIDTWELYRNYMGRVEMSEQKIRDDLVFDLKDHLRSTYLLWKDGYDMRQMLSHRKYYRHRKELLEFGIDINIPMPKKEDSNVVPLRRVIDMRPCGIPDWAYGTDLLFEPRKICNPRN